MSDHDWQAPGGPAPAPNGTEAAGTAPTGDVTAAAAARLRRRARRTGGARPPASGRTAPVPAAAPYPPPLRQPPRAAGAGLPDRRPAAWTPPPKPGLLPLRPLGFGTLLWAPFRTLRRNPAATFGSGLVVQLVSAIATAAVVVPFLA